MVKSELFRVSQARFQLETSSREKYPTQEFPANSSTPFRNLAEIGEPKTGQFARSPHPQWQLKLHKNTIFLLTGLRIYTGEYKAQGPTLCPTEGRALRGPRALYSPV